MSFLSALKGIGKAALGFVPGGGAVSAALDAAGSMGSVLGKQQEGAAQGKISQAQLQQAQDRAALDRYKAEQDAQFAAGNQDLQRQQFAQSSRNNNAKSALVAALLNGGMPGTSIAGGSQSGGLAAKLRTDPDAMAAMRNLQGQADQAQMAPPSFAGGNILQAPTQTPLPKVDQGGLLSTLATLGQLAGAASPYVQDAFKPKAKVPDLPVTSGWSGSGFGG